MQIDLSMTARPRFGPATGLALILLILLALDGCAGPSRHPTRPTVASRREVQWPGHVARDARDVDDGIPHAPGRYFESEAFHEDAVAGPHEHALVRFVGIPLFVIRDEDVYKTPPDRASDVARRLQEAIHSGDWHFIVADEVDGPAIYSVSHHGGYPHLVLRVTRGDAVAYNRRSGREVEARLLADWWLALLQDLVSVVFFDEPPRATTTMDAVSLLDRLRGGIWRAGHTEPVSPERVRAALEALSPSVRHALDALAFTVPNGFDGTGRERR